MTVSTLEQHRLSVHKNLRVFQLDFAETHFHRNHFNHAVAVFNGESGSVKVRRFGAPLVRIVNAERVSSLAAVLQRSHLLAGAVGESNVNFGSAGGGEFNLKRTVLVVGVEVRRDAHIVEFHAFVAGVEVAVACNTRKAPEVLVLEVRTVAPAERLKRNQVFAWFKVRSKVEFGFEFAVLAVSHKFAVHPKVDI